MEDLHDRWSHRWITHKKESRKSPIHGLGTFTTEDIAKGKIIAVYGGIIVPKIDIEEYRKEIGGMRGIQISDDFFICPTEPEGGLFNHSCEPNLGYINTIQVVAMEDIPSGNELVFDYGMSETNFEPYTCTCRSEKCRKIIRPTDWQNKDLQKRHGNYYATYLKNKLNPS